MALHRVGVSLSDPQHPMVSRRKEKTAKYIRVKADTPEGAKDRAKLHYEKLGYRVHDTNHIQVLKEEQEMAKSTIDIMVERAISRAGDRIEELSKDTWKRYKAKASVQKLVDNGEDDKKIDRRMKYSLKAIDKVKEDVEAVEEASSTRYVVHAGNGIVSVHKDLTSAKKSADRKETKTGQVHVVHKVHPIEGTHSHMSSEIHYQTDTGWSKDKHDAIFHHVNESLEQVREVSSGLLKRYLNKAETDQKPREEAVHRGSTDQFIKHFDKYHKRNASMGVANSKLRGEDHSWAYKKAKVKATSGNKIVKEALERLDKKCEE